MIVRVGSTNPVKIQAVKEVFEEIFPEAQVVGVEVESGVDEQPRSEEETMRGAENRARNVLRQAQDKLAEVDFGVGLEGGVMDLGGVLYECAWCVVVRRGGPPSYETTTGKGGGLNFELPPKVAKLIREGGELGPVMNELLGREDVKKQEGAVGVLTNKRVTRTGAYKQLVNLALVKFVNPDWWE